MASLRLLQLRQQRLCGAAGAAAAAAAAAEFGAGPGWSRGAGGGAERATPFDPYG
jgi:hypothetical protein